MSLIQDLKSPVKLPSLSLIVSLCVVACGESVELVDETGAPVLVYSCRRFTSIAESETEQSIVRLYATGMVRHAAEASVDIPLGDLLQADAEGDYATLERLVVGYLCGGGTVSSRREMAEEPLVFRRHVSRPAEELLALGLRAPPFSLPILSSTADLQGADSIDLTSLRGGRVLLYFWGTWCGPCREDIPELVDLERDLRGTGVRFLGVVCRESPATAREWLKNEGYEGFPNVVDEEGTVQEAFQVQAYSTTYQIGPDGLIERAWVGWNPPYPASVKKVLASLNRPTGPRD